MTSVGDVRWRPSPVYSGTNHCIGVSHHDILDVVTVRSMTSELYFVNVLLCSMALGFFCRFWCRYW